MRIKPIIAILAVPLVLLPAVAVAPAAEAASNFWVESIGYPNKPFYPVSGKGKITITTRTVGPVKSVCVAWEYASGDAWRSYVPKTFSESYLQEATEQEIGVWTFDLHYNLEGKYSAIRFSVGADDDIDCTDTVTPTERLSDETASMQVGLINFRIKASVDLETSTTAVRRGGPVVFTMTVASQPYPGIALFNSGRLERKIGSGAWEEVTTSGKDYFYCRLYTDCSINIQDIVSDKIKARVRETAQYRVVIGMTCLTAFEPVQCGFRSAPVTITLK